ncbi:MAG: TerD family protein [Pseudomonadota bacterium]
MAVSLIKGGHLSLSGEVPGLSQIYVALGWEERITEGADLDLDASAFLLKASGKVRNDNDFIFYNNLNEGGAVEHMGDNQTGGEEEEDEEIIKIDLMRLEREEPYVEKIVIAVTIYEAESREENFGEVNNAFIRIVDDETHEEIVRFDLTEDYPTETTMIFGEIYKKKGEWRFAAVGQGYSGGLAAVCSTYGVNVE